MPLRACMGGCICLSINLQPFTLKGCFFPRGHDHIKLNTNSKGNAYPYTAVHLQCVGISNPS